MILFRLFESTTPLPDCMVHMLSIGPIGKKPQPVAVAKLIDCHLCQFNLNCVVDITMVKLDYSALSAEFPLMVLFGTVGSPGPLNRSCLWAAHLFEQP